MKAVIAVVVLVLAVVAGWFLMRQPALTPPPPVAVQAPAVAPPPVPAAPDTAPAVQYPIDQVVGGPAAAGAADAPANAAAAAPPTLEESEAEVTAWAASSVGAGARALLADSNLVRRLVATVDNLPAERASTRLWPVATARGLPVVAAGDGGIVLAPANAERYRPFVAMAEAVDLDTLVSGYKRLYPVFQQAYRELGYPTGNFNDRLVAVIDHLLAAPEIEGPIALVQPKVIYEFADPALEALSAGQKIMLRMGPDNARRVKARLRLLRQRLAGKV